MKFVNYKLKFQLKTILKEKIMEILTLLIFSFTFGISEANNIFAVNANSHPSVNQYYWPFVTILFIITYIKNTYIDIWPYFMNLGYTRIKWYKNFNLLNLIIIILFSIISFLSFIIPVHEFIIKVPNVNIFYHVFNFKGLSLSSLAYIFIFKFSMILFIFSVASFISIICSLNKFLNKFVTAILMLTLILLLIGNVFVSKVVSLFFYISGNLNLTISAYIGISIIFYIVNFYIFKNKDV